MHIQLLQLLGKLRLLLLYNGFFFFFFGLVPILKSILSDIIAASIHFWLPFAWNLFFPSFHFQSVISILLFKPNLLGL